MLVATPVDWIQPGWPAGPAAGNERFSVNSRMHGHTEGGGVGPPRPEGSLGGVQRLARRNSERRGLSGHEAAACTGDMTGCLAVAALLSEKALSIVTPTPTASPGESPR